MRRQLLASAVMLLVLTVVLGFGYPLVVTGLSQLFFHKQANGSLIYRNGKLAGSALLGQSFTDTSAGKDHGNPLPQYFQPRPSDAGTGYQGNSSGASNLGPSNPLLVGFIPGVNISAKRNPYATPADPACVPVDPSGNPVTSPSPGQKYAWSSDGEFVCYAQTVPERAIAYRQFNDMAANASVPVDAVTASASGLDPDISIQNAIDQVSRVARFRHLPAA